MFSIKNSHTIFFPKRKFISLMPSLCGNSWWKLYIFCALLCVLASHFFWKHEIFSYIRWYKNHSSIYPLSYDFISKEKRFILDHRWQIQKFPGQKKTPQFAYKNVTWSWFPIEEETQIFTFLLWNSYMLFDRKSTSDRLYWPLNAVQSRFWSVLVDSPCSLRYICLFQD